MSLTLTPEELQELTGYKRGAEQCRWLKANGFKFRIDRTRRPRVDRAHYESKMGVPLQRDEPRYEGAAPNWSALLPGAMQ